MLETERKIIIDTVKMLCYRAETELFNLIYPFFSRQEDEGRIRKKGVKFHIQKNIAKSLGCLSLLTKTRDVKFPCNNT